MADSTNTVVRGTVITCNGALAGGALRGWKSGPRAVLPGALTIGALCTILQMAYNEAGIIRLRFISSSLKVPTPVTASSPKKPVMERFLDWVGVHQVTDEEYIAKMKATRAKHLARIAELEEQLAADKTKALEKS
ncbi:hypothetical protein H0H81_002367 [Sphagnurus paluster]|uniref:Uncharacterized protein n=1 Tax=Sphagnurus paluster TaxID=117069 RepID=A0A9P7KGN0_9AGAR|nr:hypothetical protein H0H81_002367 [Sphagnurus paluster]